MEKVSKKNKRIKVFFITAAVLLALAILLLFIARNIFPLKYEGLIEQNSKKYYVDKYLIMAVIRTESGYREKALSKAEAMGLMQITEETGEHIAEELGIEKYSKSMLYDPEINIEFGTWYLNWLLEQFDGDLKNALAAYNAGIGNVENWLLNKEYSEDGKNLDRIPFEETENFINRVELYRNIYKILY